MKYDREQHWLVFTNTGDGYYPPEPILAGQPLTPYLEGLAEPTYTGYTFQGWVTGTNDEPVPEVMPDSDLTVRAKWKGALVDYTILVWLENAEDEDYTLAGDLKKQAYAGDRLTVVGTDSGFSVKAGDGNWESISVSDYAKLAEISDYIRYSSSDSGVEVRGNGGTILNVYYDRNIYTIRFDIGFARSDVNWGYSSRTQEQALASHEQVYGLINGSYVPLKYVNNQWTYSGLVNEQREYTEARYKEDSSDLAIYGIVNGVVVPLTNETGYVYQWQYYRNWWRDASSGAILYLKIDNVYRESGLTTSSSFADNNGIVVFQRHDYLYFLVPMSGVSLSLDVVIQHNRAFAVVFYSFVVT